MITFDGNRSKKRKWFAEKQLRLAKELDVPSRTVIWEGFSIRTWQQDDLTGGSVRAPMGAIVMCSNATGIKIATADYWAGAFTGLTDLHLVYYEVSGPSSTFNDTIATKLFNGASETAMLSDGNQIIKFKPSSYMSPYNTDYGTLGDDVEWVVNYSCRPSLMPFKGSEAYWFAMTDQVFLDLNGTGVYSHTKYICESALNFYSADASNLGGRIGFDTQLENYTSTPWRFIQQISKLETTSFFTSMFYMSINNNKVVTTNFTYPNDSLAPVDGIVTGLATSYTYLYELIQAGSMPTKLRNILLNPSGFISCGPIGTYCFEHEGQRATLHVVDATNTLYWTADSPSEDYFDSHPEDEHWKLFYVLKIGEICYIISSNQFGSLLENIAGVSEFQWKQKRNMLSQLSSPGPTNANWLVPYDSYMFHGHNGNVYTWSRKYGLYKFTPTGLFKELSYSVPIEVTQEEGVTPVITYAGLTDGVPTYMCMCEKPKDGIRAIYVGSPFVEWIKLTDIDFTLSFVRPIKASLAEVYLIGVAKVTVNEVPEYRFTFINWKKDLLSSWNIMGKLPFEVDTENNFSATLFGSGSLVQDLLKYKTQPVAQPQMPIGPYETYARSQP